MVETPVVEEVVDVVGVQPSVVSCRGHGLRRVDSFGGSCGGRCRYRDGTVDR